MEKIELILFDLGGVLIDINYQLTKKAFEDLGVSDFDDFYTQFKQQDLFNRYETGQISSQHFINQLLPITQKGTSPNQIVQAWNAMILSFPIEKKKLIDSLKTQRRIALLSNTNELHMIQVHRQWSKVSQESFQSQFERVFLSHEINQRKPDKETFRWVCNEVGVSPEKILFIDDSPQHIEGAKEIGMRTFLYENSSGFYALFS